MAWTYIRHWTNGMNTKQYIWDIFRETNCVGTKWNITLSHIPYQTKRPMNDVPDSEVHGASMGFTLVLSSPDGPYDGPSELCYQGLNVILRNVLWQRHSIWCHFDFLYCDCFTALPTLLTLMTNTSFGTIYHRANLLREKRKYPTLVKRQVSYITFVITA